MDRYETMLAYEKDLNGMHYIIETDSVKGDRFTIMLGTNKGTKIHEHKQIPGGKYIPGKTHTTASVETI